MYIWDCNSIYIAFDWRVVVENFGVVTGGLKDLYNVVTIFGYGILAYSFECSSE